MVIVLYIYDLQNRNEWPQTIIRKTSDFNRSMTSVLFKFVRNIKTEYEKLPTQGEPKETRQQNVVL
jgi:hypothetical protein